MKTGSLSLAGFQNLTLREGTWTPDPPLSSKGHRNVSLRRFSILAKNLLYTIPKPAGGGALGGERTMNDVRLYSELL